MFSSVLHGLFCILLKRVTLERFEMPRIHMSREEAARAVGRLMAGQSQRQGAAVHGVSQSVIQRL